jgi:hypothetical protein
MVITVKKTTEKQVVVKTPCYRRKGSDYVKIIEEHLYLAVAFGEYTSPGIQITTYIIDMFFDEQSIEITEAEFIEVYNKTKAAIELAANINQ